MMTFQPDLAFAAELVALAFGTGLFVALDKWQIANRFAKFVSIFIIAASILGMACTVARVLKSGCCKSGGGCPSNYMKHHTGGHMRHHSGHHDHAGHRMEHHGDHMKPGSEQVPPAAQP